MKCNMTEPKQKLTLKLIEERFDHDTECDGFCNGLDFTQPLVPCRSFCYAHCHECVDRVLFGNGIICNHPLHYGGFEVSAEKKQYDPAGLLERRVEFAIKHIDRVFLKWCMGIFVKKRKRGRKIIYIRLFDSTFNTWRTFSKFLLGFNSNGFRLNSEREIINCEKQEVLKTFLSIVAVDKGVWLELLLPHLFEPLSELVLQFLGIS